MVKLLLATVVINHFFRKNTTSTTSAVGLRESWHSLFCPNICIHFWTFCTLPFSQNRITCCTHLYSCLPFYIFLFYDKLGGNLNDLFFYFCLKFKKFIKLIIYQIWNFCGRELFLVYEEGNKKDATTYFQHHYNNQED